MGIRRSMRQQFVVCVGVHTWARHVQLNHLRVAVVVQPPVRLDNVQQDLALRIVQTFGSR